MHYNVQLHTESITLSITTTKKLKKPEGVLQNFGYIEISTGYTIDKDIFWDNLDFFINCSKKEFQKECAEDIKELGFHWREVYSQIKKLINKAIKLNLITVEEKNLKVFKQKVETTEEIFNKAMESYGK